MAHERILKVTKQVGDLWLYTPEPGTNHIPFEKVVTPDERDAMGDDSVMYCVYQHGVTFSSRIAPKQTW